MAKKQIQNYKFFPGVVPPAYDEYTNAVALLLANKDFIIGITNITKDRVEYINHLNYPDMPIYLALRITCCIPILYEPILYKDCYYIDGGLKDNFPIQLIHLAQQSGPERQLD